MEKLTARKQAILDVLDDQIDELEKKLAKVQPLINELNQLKATRRTLLAEKGNTGGAGHPSTQLTMEMVINYMREHEDGVEPADIAEHYGVPGTIVRSHLSRHNGTRYARDEDGLWGLIGNGDGQPDDEEE
jgi:hypothetical protein